MDERKEKKKKGKNKDRAGSCPGRPGRDTVLCTSGVLVVPASALGTLEKGHGSRLIEKKNAKIREKCCRLARLQCNSNRSDLQKPITR